MGNVTAVQVTPELIVSTIAVYLTTFFFFGTELFSTSGLNVGNCTGVVSCTTSIFGFVPLLIRFIFLIGISGLPVWVGVIVFLWVPFRWAIVVIQLLIGLIP